MQNQLLCLLLLAITALTQESAPGPNQIIEFFRHGARSPINNFDHTWHDYVTLTPVGYRQHYILGKVLAKKYPNLIENAYKNNLVSLSSSHAPRCIQSAGAHLHGMFSNFDNKGIALRDNYPRELAIPGFEDSSVAEIANSIPNTQSIPYDFFPGLFNIADQDGMYVFAGEQPHWCPKMERLRKENRFDSSTEAMFKEFGGTVNYLNSILHAELRINDPDDFLNYADPMFADIYDNRTLLGGLKDQAVITNITWAATWFYYHFMQGQQIQRELSSFYVIEAFLEQLASFRKGESYSTVALFSGHDNNLLAVLSAFGIINKECIMENFHSVLKTGEVKHPACQYPTFASNIIAEFYNETETPYVKLSHKNIPLKICNGKYECPYEEFIIWARSTAGNNTRETYIEKCEATPQPKGPASLKQTSHKKPLVFTTPKQRVISEDGVTVQVVLNAVLAIVCMGLIFKIIYDKRRYVKMITRVSEKQIVYQHQEDLEDKTIGEI